MKNIIKNIRYYFVIGINMVFLLSCTGEKREAILEFKEYAHYFKEFNNGDKEIYKQFVPNASAIEFLESNIPLLDIPDSLIQKAYYFRWWTFRKHIKKTPDGFVITEFLPDVDWAGEYNTISAPAGHQVMEGRWLRNQVYLDDYISFWYNSKTDGKPENHLFNYSNWLGYAVWQKFLVDGDTQFLIRQLPGMKASFEHWKSTNSLESNVYWSYDVRDGMEESISGSRIKENARATISSYQYGLAFAIAQIAEMAGKQKLYEGFSGKAELIKTAINNQLWDKEANFYKVRFDDGSLSDVRELHGYVPWYFNIPKVDYTLAWNQLFDRKGFYAPYGPTTAEQRHPDFSLQKCYTSNKACRWDGPSWPFATSQTLTSLANLLNNFHQDLVSKEQYFDILRIYAKSQQRLTYTGHTIPWIDESIDPLTGEWITRKRFEEENFNGWGTGGSLGKPERGKDYNHSTFADLVITGLIGLKPRSDNNIEVNPLIPDEWDWFCLDKVRYHGKDLTILWDRDGIRYKKGKGFTIIYDGKKIYNSPILANTQLSI